MPPAFQTIDDILQLPLQSVTVSVGDPVREAPRFDAALADLMAAVRAKGLEGLVAKRLDSVYDPGARSGAWRKMRINRSGELVIGGYTRGGRTFDALVLGKWDGDRLVCVARTRVGFSPASRDRLMAKLLPPEIVMCPFANLPEARSGRWGEGLTAEKMKECVGVLCRIRNSSHNVGCQTLPHRLLPVLPLLRSTSICSA